MSCKQLCDYTPIALGRHDSEVAFFLMACRRCPDRQWAAYRTDWVQRWITDFEGEPVDCEDDG